MNHSAQRIVAIVLACSFALVGSLVIGWFVFQNTFGSTDAPTDRKVEREVSGPTDRPQPPEKTGESTSPEKPKPERMSESEFGSPDDVLDEYPDRGPRMTARTPEGDEVILPMMKSDYSVDIRGDLATVTVEQTFENPGEVPLNATYQLPMSEDAAVYQMIMRVGDRRIRGVVKEKEQARKEYEAAKEQGRAAALLEQQRANLFTQKLANVMPNKPVHVTIRYVQNVEKSDGNYHLVVPLVVGPRYNPADMSGNELVDSDGSSSQTQSDTGTSGDTPDLPPVGELQAPETVEPDRIGLDVRLDGGVPVAGVGSSSHDITIEKRDPTTRTVELTKGRTIGNRHFVLSYKLEGRSTQAGVLTHWSEKREEGYFSILVEPPAEPSSEEVAAREMVFLLDTSGSMRGAPMEASKAYMRHTLRNLRPEDSFRIVEFDSNTGAMSESALPATEENIQKGLAYVGRLRGDGGTELVPGLKRALGPEPSGDRIRIATVLSDGYVGNEYEVVRTVREEIGETRLTVLGVGHGTNRFALEEMAELGRGFTRYIDPGARGSDSIRETAKEVAEKLETPVLTDLSVDWGKLSPHQTTPERIPDLFAGESVRIMGRYEEPGSYELELSGRAGSKQVDIPLEVELPGKPTDGKSVELTWARSRVEDFMHQLMTPDQLRQTSLSDKDLKRLVTQLGLDHDIATKWTSFIAVSEKVVNPDAENSVDAAVPEPQVENVSSSGYARGASGAHGAPEPSIVISLLMTLLACPGIVGREP